MCMPLRRGEDRSRLALVLRQPPVRRPCDQAPDCGARLHRLEECLRPFWRQRQIFAHAAEIAALRWLRGHAMQDQPGDERPGLSIPVR